eukprot:CAMPEP_0183348158 /NCGR_PEP_ID=MMETSP0164_2-20130417/12764_1 /TAXON_ID=221442 /ORGANISM="Coccolithus pelagicus ssp braarudi, Strain PLY182g" /LENGTH=96 /DNA_ID=CAMNT_0025519713 /DNA_START=369 /DNA_END=655 /DNA_ORIENTATION=-
MPCSTICSIQLCPRHGVAGLVSRMGRAPYDTRTGEFTSQARLAAWQLPIGRLSKIVVPPIPLIVPARSRELLFLAVSDSRHAARADEGSRPPSRPP